LLGDLHEDRTAHLLYMCRTCVQPMYGWLVQSLGMPRVQVSCLRWSSCEFPILSGFLKIFPTSLTWLTEAVSQKIGTISTLRDSNTRYLHPTNGHKQPTPVVELGKAERSWGEWQFCRRTSSLNLDPQDFSNTGPPESIHQLIWDPQHTHNRGLLGLCSFRDNVPNPQETGGPREFRGQVG
jgi:hypothetical protein